MPPVQTEPGLVWMMNIGIIQPWLLADGAW